MISPDRMKKGPLAQQNPVDAPSHLKLHLFARAQGKHNGECILMMWRRGDALLLSGGFCEHAGMLPWPCKGPRKITPVNDFVSSLSRGSRPVDVPPLSEWCLSKPLCAAKLLFGARAPPNHPNQWAKKHECDPLEGHLSTPLSPCCAEVWPSTLQLM